MGTEITPEIAQQLADEGAEISEQRKARRRSSKTEDAYHRILTLEAEVQNLWTEICELQEKFQKLKDVL